MEISNPALEWQRLVELYQAKNDEELADLALNYSDLTSIAQQVLEREFSNRRLEMPKAESKPDDALDFAPPIESDPESVYADDRKMVDIATVWSPRDAVQLKEILDSAGIPVVFGNEKVSRVEAV